MKEEQIFIVDYACGFHPYVCEVDYTCALRCQAALRAFKKYPNAKFVLGAGMGNLTGSCGSLSDMMREFLIEHDVPAQSILVNDKGFNTLTETEAAYKVIEKNGGGRIICATSAYHAPRVWCIWLFRFGVVPEMYVSHLNPNTKDRIKEYIKVPLDAIRAFVHRVFNLK